jgi:aspartyl-tRNA(Asn)/glutamyl-tRNA(Gln) amidotransferase subunit B
MAEFFEAAVTDRGRARQGDQQRDAQRPVDASERRGHLGLESKVVPAMVAELVALVEDGTISSKQAKDVFAEMAETGDAPGAIVELRGMKQVSDTGAIEEVVDRVIAANPAQVEQYRGGKTGVIGFFVGQVMREMGGQANPKVVNEVLSGVGPVGVPRV